MANVAILSRSHLSESFHLLGLRHPVAARLSEYWLLRDRFELLYVSRSKVSPAATYKSFVYLPFSLFLSSCSGVMG
jgi:hypothetical protein